MSNDPHRLDSHRVAEEAIVVSAFRHGVAVSDIATVIGKSPQFVARMLGNAGVTIIDPPKPPPDPLEDADEADSLPTRNCVAGDLAFQNAMHKAIRRGLERPPMIGVSKNSTPLEFQRHYHRAPLHSGCSSPARDCAELSSMSGKVAV